MYPSWIPICFPPPPLPKKKHFRGEILKVANDVISMLFPSPCARRGLFPFRKQAMPFLTVDAIIGNQAFQNGRCYIFFISGLNKVETGYSC